MDRFYCFDQFVFDAETGELFRAADTGDPPAHEPSESPPIARLAPQPAKLLQLLLATSPELTSREAIRQELWPNITVDFDRNVHLYVRQIRAALGDSASSSQIVETIPRRGYRIRPTVQCMASLEQPVPQASTEQAQPECQPSRSQVPLVRDLSSQPAKHVDPRDGHSARNPRQAHQGLVAAALMGLTIALPLTTILAASMSTRPMPVSSTTPRLGIMPLQFRDARESWLQDNGLAERLLGRLSSESPMRVEVIGPTTTDSFAARQDGIQQLIDSYELDFIVNGRHIGDGQNERMLLELIRASDGVHLWVREMDHQDTSDALIDECVENLYTLFEHR